jgi:S-adenosylmethionine:tRNA ribosyltransferase-isomerase
MNPEQAKIMTAPYPAVQGDKVPRVYRLSTYDYELPPEQIAQCPSETRDGSRLMTIRRKSGTFSHSTFGKLTSSLRPTDVLVLNETRVTPALLLGRKSSGGRVEILVLDPAGTAQGWANEKRAVRVCLVRSSKPVRPGTIIEIGRGERVTVLESVASGRVRMQFEIAEPDFIDFLDVHGHPPLPPYIKHENRDFDRDRSRYQTVYGRVAGSVAAPTAGLHFTEEILGELQEQRVTLCKIVLHVGPGTFTPVREADIRRHTMESEYYEIPEEASERINAAIRDGRRIIAVGTTSVRALESSAAREKGLGPGRGTTDLFITPGHSFKVVRGMLTNFHLPRSSLLMLVCSFAGTELMLAAYAEAVRRKYRFYSYGDACLIMD